MPVPLLYPWQRRWLPATPTADQLSLPYQVDSSGYVALESWSLGPETAWVGLTLEELPEQHRCVVLLGEPGMGKSQEWRTQQTRLAGQPNHLFLDLGGIDSEEVLRREIFEAAPVVAWRTDDSTLTLWLDSLDEGLLHVSTLQQALLRVLRAPLPLDRLCLRVLCRSAVWPAGFSEALAQQLRLPEPDAAGADAAFLTLLLCPLSRDQVAQAATCEAFDSPDFLAAVAAADAQPLAGRPVTLRLLVQLYRAHGPTFGLTEAAGRAGLYERGCLELCERPDRGRPEEHRFDPHRRLLLAGYVALLSVLTNRRVLLAEPAPGLPGPNELDVYALSGGTTAAWRGTTAPLTVPALRDLFRATGLFTDLGRGRLVWAHQSYAEFLAAWYLQLTGLPVASLRALFRSAADPAGGIVPALHETAAWLADFRPDFWLEMLALDPLALLQSDLRRLSPAQRARVVERLVQWLTGLAYPPYQSVAFLEHLAHPGLAEQLAPLLADPTTPSAVARFATDLAKVAQVRGLQPLLLAQALDPAGPLPLRNRALFILYDVADAAAREALRPLCAAIPADDASDELRGHLLHLLWPTHLRVEELLPLLTRRKNQSLYGAYHRFLDDLERGQLALTRDSLLLSLRWVTQHTPRWRDTEQNFWQQTARYLQQRAWETVEDPEVAAVLAGALVAAAREHQPFHVGGTAEQRLAMLARLLPRHRQLEYHNLASNSFGPSTGPTLVRTEDWPAVYALLNTPLTAAARGWLAQILKQLLQALLNSGSPNYCARYEALHRAAQRFASVRASFAPWCTPTSLDDAREVRNAKWRQEERARKRQAARRRRCRRSLNLHGSVKIRRAIRHVLRKGAAATLPDWAVLARRIATTQAKRIVAEPHDVATARRWHCLTAAQQSQAADVAQAVLAAYPTLPADWGAPDRWIVEDAVLLHRALLLLQHQRPAYLDTLPAAFWESWATFLVEYRSSAHDQPPVVALLRRAGAAAPAAVEEAIFRVADAHGQREGSVMPDFANLCQALPDLPFAVRLLRAVQAGAWHDDSSGYLLVEMLKTGYAPAWEYAEQLLAEPTAGPPAQCARPRLAKPVYHWLLFDRTRQEVDPWPWWQRLSTQPALARQVVTAAVYHASARELRQLALLDEAQLETLMLWLTQVFALAPDDVDDWDDRPKGRLAAVRTAAAFELAARGTPQARDALQGLAVYLGQPFWLRARLDQVRQNLRRNAWEPLPPDALATLSREADRRWVRSATDLQDLLLESFARFQTDLQGEPTTAQVLWIPLKDPAHRARITGYEVHEENYVSNVLRQHLRQDLQRANVLVKREVEIRPALGRGTGQRTDIFVEAFTRSPAGDKLDVVTVVVEVKLSRNAEVAQALESQLVAYLADQSYKHGIYLVGWHYGQYDPKPSGKPDLPALTALLTQQAAAAAPAYQIKPCVIDIRLPADDSRERRPAS